MLAQPFTNSILMALASGRFVSSDFSLAVDDGGSYIRVLISFVPQPLYRMKGEIVKEKKPIADPELGGQRVYVHPCTLEVCPGETLQVESATVYGTDALLDAILEWTNRIDAELKALPFARALQEQASRIDKISAQLEEMDPTEYFTHEQAEVLRARIDEMEAALLASLAKQAVEQARIKADFETLRGTISAVPKKGWLKMFWSRVAAMSKNPVAQKFLADVVEDGVKKLLGP